LVVQSVLVVRRYIRVVGLAGAALATVFGAAACSSANHAGGSGIVTNGAYVEQPASAGQTTVGYLDIRNNGAADELLSVSTSVGGAVELRGPVGKGVSPVVMHTIKDIPIPSDKTTQLIPNSFHLLITDPGAMHDGKDIYLKLTFAHAGSMTVIALVTNPQNGGSSYFLN
jgi:periplasmic copper chaperone A